MTGHFIGGEETPSTSGAEFPVFSPRTGQRIGAAARGGAEDVDRAVASAKRAFLAWSQMAPAERERLFLRAADALEARRDTLVDLVIDESGSTITKARGEVDYGASLLRTAAGEVRRLYGDTFPNDKPHRLSIVLREPLGVVAAISPFNAPLVLLVKMIAFPLAAGNTVIAKPSEETPLVAVELAKVLASAGFPPGVFNVVTGHGREAGERLVVHPDVHGVTFTGSTATGTRIAEAAMAGLKRVHLELGGNNPLLVLADYPVEAAAELAARGAYAHAGQICMASSRIIVESAIARPFAEALAAQARAMVLGDLRDPRTSYGPLIHRAALEKVERHVRDAIDHGAELLAGGAVVSDLTYAATVLFRPALDSLPWREETFGPVASVVEARDLDHAIELANDSVYGLSAGVLTRDLERGLGAARRIRAGAVHLGTHSFQSDALAPIGGLGRSGIGRSGGKYSVEHFTELKWISFETTQEGRR